MVVPDNMEIQAATLFITANPPAANEESGHERPPKVLGAYKVWINSELIGVGPGRPRCMAQPSSCVHGSPEQVYDGFDVTAAVASAKNVEVFIASYGLDKSSAGVPRVWAELHVVLGPSIGATKQNMGNTLMVLATNSSWQSFDADKVYNPGPNSGCSWYYVSVLYFHNSVDISCLYSVVVSDHKVHLF